MSTFDIPLDGLAWGQIISPADALVGDNERRIELPLAVDRMRYDQPGWVLDAGCALIPTLAAMPKNYPLRAQVVHLTQAIGSERIKPRESALSFMSADLRDLSIFRDRAFERVACVSTLEHVGLDNTGYGAWWEADPGSVVKAWRELIRVTKQRLFITVPFRQEAASSHPRWQYFTPPLLHQLHTDLHLLGGMETDTRFYGRLDASNRWFGGDTSPVLSLIQQPLSERVAQIACISAER